MTHAPDPRAEAKRSRAHAFSLRKSCEKGETRLCARSRIQNRTLRVPLFLWALVLNANTVCACSISIHNSSNFVSNARPGPFGGQPPTSVNKYRTGAYKITEHCAITQTANEESLSVVNDKTASGEEHIFAQFEVKSGADGGGAVNAYIGAVNAYIGGFFINLADGDLKCTTIRCRQFECWQTTIRCPAKYDSSGKGGAKVGDTIGVLVHAGKDGFVRYFRNGEKMNREFSLKDFSEFQANNSSLVIAVRMESKGVSLELLPGQSKPAMSGSCTIGVKWGSLLALVMSAVWCACNVVL